MGISVWVGYTRLDFQRTIAIPEYELILVTFTSFKLLAVINLLINSFHFSITHFGCKPANCFFNKTNLISTNGN